MALRAIARGAGRVGVDIGQRGHDRVIGRSVAGRALRSARYRDVIGRLRFRCNKESGAGMALRAIARVRVRRIRHAVGRRRGHGAGMKARVLRLVDDRRWRDRVGGHPHPGEIGVVACVAATGNTLMNLRVARRRRRETTARRRARGVGIDQTGRHRGQVTTLADDGRRDMRARPGRRRRRHDHNAADPGERAALDRRTVAVGTAAVHSGMVHLPTRKARETGERLRMAVGALRGVAAGYVVGRHAPGLLSIMASPAGAGVASQGFMGKIARRGKRQGRMANIA